MGIKDFEEFWDNREFSFHRISTLIIIYLVLSVGLMTVLIPFVSLYTKNSYIHASISFTLFLLIAILWQRNRVVFPKSKNSKEHIVIAIITENAKQKVRIAHDFTEQIKKQIRSFNLGNYDVIVLHNYQSKILQDRIRLYNDSVGSNMATVDIDKFFHLTKRLNAKFVVYGNLIQRNSGECAYALNIEAMILHESTSKGNKNALNTEFQRVWKNEISFFEREELTGFKTNANQVFFASSYMLALATFVDNEYEKGIKICEGIERYIKANPELNSFLKSTVRVKSASCYLLSRFLYKNGEIETSIKYRKMYQELVPNAYSSYLLESVKQINVHNDIELALEFNDKAMKIAPADEHTWKYNNLYLFIKLPNAKQALDNLDDIINSNFKLERDAMVDVFSYNEACLKADPSHIQTYFILGVLKYKKLNDPIGAYVDLENFVKMNNNPAWNLLIERSKQYLSEIDTTIIGVKS